MSKCIKCGQPATTTIQMVLNNKSYDVGLCDKHADLSIKEIKEILNRQAESIAQFRQLAANMGYDLVPRGDQPIVEEEVENEPIENEPTIANEKAEESKKVKKSKKQSGKQCKNLESPVRGRRGRKRPLPKISSVEEGVPAPATTPYNIKDKEELKEINLDDCGSVRILPKDACNEIAKMYTERRNYVSSSEMNKMTCGLCHGSGFVDDEVCQRCNGVGFIFTVPGMPQ